ASVVLPRPGGPKNSTWSIASPRPRAASMNTRKFSRAASCPTNSPSDLGRSAAAGSSGWRWGGGVGVSVSDHLAPDLPGVVQDTLDQDPAGHRTVVNPMTAVSQRAGVRPKIVTSDPHSGKVSKANEGFMQSAQIFRRRRRAELRGAVLL